MIIYFLVNHFKLLKIPHGVSFFGFACLGIGYLFNKRNRDRIRSQEDRLNSRFDRLEQQQSTIQSNQESLREQQARLQDSVDHLDSKANEIITSIKNKFTDFNPSDMYNEILDYLLSIPEQNVILLFNIASSILLLSLIFSQFLIYYSNYLIEVWELPIKYPRLKKFLELRKIYQKYYFIYNMVLIILNVFLMLFFNIYLLFF